MNVNLIMVPTSIVATVSSTIIAWRSHEGAKSVGKNAAGRVIEGYCGATCDARTCVVLEGDVWHVVFD